MVKQSIARIQEEISQVKLLFLICFVLAALGVVSVVLTYTLGDMILLSVSSGLLVIGFIGLIYCGSRIAKLSKLL